MVAVQRKNGNFSTELTVACASAAFWLRSHKISFDYFYSYVGKNIFFSLKKTDKIPECHFVL